MVGAVGSVGDDVGYMNFVGWDAEAAVRYLFSDSHQGTKV